MISAEFIKLTIFFLIFCLIKLPSLSHCHQIYQLQIPNGQSVVDPCSPSGDAWQGVGHFASGGAGPRNPFGLDFAAAGHMWTKSLCESDSDGDGVSNGKELGDPECIWKEGDTPARTTDITHPGICDPVTSSECKTRNANFNLKC